jgi:hypothetical protein
MQVCDRTRIRAIRLTPRRQVDRPARLIGDLGLLLEIIRAARGWPRGSSTDNTSITRVAANLFGPG